MPRARALDPSDVAQGGGERVAPTGEHRSHVPGPEHGRRLGSSTAHGVENASHIGSDSLRRCVVSRLPTGPADVALGASHGVTGRRSEERARERFPRRGHVARVNKDATIGAPGPSWPRRHGDLRHPATLTRQRRFSRRKRTGRVRGVSV